MEGFDLVLLEDFEGDQWVALVINGRLQVMRIDLAVDLLGALADVLETSEASEGGVN